MNKKSPTFCVMPHIGLAVQNDGDICCCNLIKENFELNGKTLFT